MNKKKNQYTKKKVFYARIKVGILFCIVVVLGLIIINPKSSSTQINKLSASYISLKNPDTTDILKVTNLSKLSDKKGMSNHNKCVKSFKMIGQRDSDYKIVLYNLGKIIDEKYVKFYLVNEKGKIVKGCIEDQEESYDGGRVLFVGNMMDGQNWSLKMWVDRKYEKSVKNVSYEIRIK